MKKTLILMMSIFFCLPAALFAAENTPYKILGDSDFAENTKDKLVFIDFYADWCGPCKQFAPVFEAVAASRPDLTFVKVDTDASPQLSAAFKISSIPYIVAYKDNKVIAKFNSFPRTETSFGNWVQKVVEAVEKQK